MKSFRVLFYVLLLASAGCAADPPQTQGNLTFFDSDSFDSQLSTRLGGENAQVTVATMGPVTLNDMPKRLNAWLAAVTDRGGQVVVVNAGNADPGSGRPRFLGAIIATIGQAFVEGMISMVRERRLYGPAKAYDATLVIAPDSGQIQQVYFTRKGA